jgi:hypothetical protein
MRKPARRITNRELFPTRLKTGAAALLSYPFGNEADALEELSKGSGVTTNDIKSGSEPPLSSQVRGGPLFGCPDGFGGGAALMAVIGILFFKEPATLIRLSGIMPSIIGLFLLRYSRAK